ncbi:THAP-type domain-containing protein, partial [Aphis craccivora]
TCALAEFVNVHVGGFVSHRRTMRRHRRQTQPVSPRSMTEFHHQLSGDYHHLSKVDDVTLYSGIISNTPQEGVILLTGTTFLFDGTFASAPSFGNECQQLYVIMGITFNTGFPIGFALMSRKTECAYSALFNKILIIVLEWQPQTIVIDFERAAIASIRSLFSNTVIRGCWFHSSNAVWRKAGYILKITRVCFCN